MIERKRIDFLDVAVTIAIIRVVSVHALNNFFIVTTGRPAGLMQMPRWAQVLDLAMRYSVPLFVLVSGAKYAHSTQPSSVGSYFAWIIRRSKRLLRPYLIWSILFYLLYPQIWGYIPKQAVYANYPFPDLHSIWSIINGSANPGYQLWFIPMLFLLSVIYPPVFKFLPACLSQSIFWILFLHARLNHIEIPFNYYSYLAFFDLGARLAVAYHHSGYPKKFAYPATFILCSASFLSFLIQLGKIPWLPVTAGAIASEISVPLAILSLSAVVFPVSAPRTLTALTGFVWPVFILHEPFLLGKTAWFIYVTAGFRHPSAIPLIIAVSIILSIFLYLGFKRLRLNMYFF